MNLFQSINLSNVAPIVALAAIAVLIVAALLLRTVLHSRLAVLIAIVIGVVVAGPALGGALTAVVNSLAIVVIVCAGATLAALLIIRSHPDLLALSRDALSLLPQRSPIVIPSPAKGEGRDEGSITIIDQPAPRTRAVYNRVNGGSDWGF